MRLLTTYLHTIITSFYSTKTYINVKNNWQGLGIGYLLVLSIICTLPISLTLYNGVNKYFYSSIDGEISIPEDLSNMVAQFPEMTISGDKLTTKEKGTFLIKLPDREDDFIIIDTTGLLKSVKETSAQLLITNEYISYLNPLTGENTFSYQEVISQLQLDATKEYIIDKDLLTQTIEDIIKNKNPIILYISLIFISTTLFQYGLNILIFAGVGIFIAEIFKIKIRFIQLIRLSAVAATPIIIIKTIAILTGGLFSYPTIIYPLMQLAYLYHAIDCSKKETV